MEYGAPRDNTQKYRDSGESHMSASIGNLRQIIEHDCRAVDIRECLLGGGRGNDSP
jgi:hypothetical protein